MIHRSSLLWAGLAFVAFLTGLSVLLSGQAPRLDEAPEPGDRFEAEALAQPSEHALATTPAIAAGKAQEDVVNRYMCRGEFECSQQAASDEHMASSPEEALWMQAEGFPTREELAWADGRSASEILLKATESDSLPLRMLGLRMRLTEEIRQEEANKILGEFQNLYFNGKLSYAAYGYIEASQRALSLGFSERGLDTPEAATWGMAEMTHANILVAIYLGDYKAASLYSGLPKSYLEFATPGSLAARNAERSAWARLGSGNPAIGLSFRDASPRPAKAI